MEKTLDSNGGWRSTPWWTAACLLTSACGQSPEQVVTSTRHCTDVQLTPDLMMRLSSYAGHPDSIRLLVVQACHSTGTACSPLLTYRDALPPVYEVRGSTVTVHLLGGGSEPKVHHDKIKTGLNEYALDVNRIRGNVGKSGVQTFQRQIRHRCPLSNQRYPR